LTYPPYINLIFDIVIANNGDEPPKDQKQLQFRLAFLLESIKPTTSVKYMRW